MTGGGSFRAEVGAEAVFERLGRELSGYYRIGVEKDADRRRRQGPADEGAGRADGRDRARPRDLRRAHLRGSRLGGAAGLRARGADPGDRPSALRVTSYLAADPDDPTRVKIILSGEASRLDPGEATVQLLVRDLEGKKLLAGEQPIGEPRGDGLAFSANVPSRRAATSSGSAVIDGAGRVGSVDHRVDARRSPLGPVTATGPRAAAAARAGPGRAPPRARHGQAGRAAGGADRSRWRADADPERRGRFRDRHDRRRARR